MADIKISELEPTTDLMGLYTIGSDKNSQSKKVSLQFLKDAADYAKEQGDYAKQEGETIESRITDLTAETNAKLDELSEETSARFSESAESTREQIKTLEDKAESKFASVDSEIENLKKGEAYVMGESLVFRNYADATIIGNTLTL